MFFPAHTAVEIVREYKIPEKINFKFQSKNGWIIATSPDLPGFVTEAKNSTELLGMLNDGILTYFDVPRRVGDIVHDSMTIDGIGTVTLGEKPQTV